MRNHKYQAGNSYSLNQSLQEEVRGPSLESQGREIIAKVVGVTFEGRQEVVARLHLGEQVHLRREPSNLYDSNAIRVERLNREQIGYLNRRLFTQSGDRLTGLEGTNHALFLTQ